MFVTTIYLKILKGRGVEVNDQHRQRVRLRRKFRSPMIGGDNSLLIVNVELESDDGD